MPVTERDDLVAFQLLMAAEADVVATLFGRSRRAIAMNDRDIEKLVLVELHHRTAKNGVDAAIGLPPSPRAIDPRVVNLRTTLAILVDRQLLPLTTQIKQVQNVVEDLVKAELRCRTSAPDGEMRQDKLLKLPEPQLRRNRLSALASSHSDPPESWTLPRSTVSV